PPGRCTPPAPVAATASRSSCAMTIALYGLPSATSSASSARRPFAGKSFSLRLNQRQPPAKAAAATSVNDSLVCDRSEITSSGGDGGNGGKPATPRRPPRGGAGLAPLPHRGRGRRATAPPTRGG